MTHCAVTGCTNGSYALEKWKIKVCDEHSNASEHFGCPPPFELLTFPGRKHQPQKFRDWVALINRLDKNGKSWLPGQKSRVCTRHFRLAYPNYPTIHLGYDAKSKISNLAINLFETPSTKTRHLFHPSQIPSMASKRRSLPTEPILAKPPPRPTVPNLAPTAPGLTLTAPGLAPTIPGLASTVPDLAPTAPGPASATLFALPVIQKDVAIQLQKFQLENLELKRSERKLKLKNIALFVDNRRLRSEMDMKKTEQIATAQEKPMFKRLLTNKKSCLFYTGIKDVATFGAIHKLVSPLIRKKWRGKNTGVLRRKLKKMPKLFGPKRKLQTKDELLLTLMKLRLNLMFKDLAERFGVSLSLASRIFVTWVRALATVLGATIFLPDQGSLNATRPARFSHVKNIHSIIDATEIFIETPKNPDLQKVTWSQYKHHNTIKILVCVTPNSSICFVSKAYILAQQLAVFLINVLQTIVVCGGKRFRYHKGVLGAFYNTTCSTW